MPRKKTKVEAGYFIATAYGTEEELGLFCCGTCDHANFEGPVAKCSKVEGVINDADCCNGWHNDDLAVPADENTP